MVCASVTNKRAVSNALFNLKMARNLNETVGSDTPNVDQGGE